MKVSSFYFYRSKFRVYFYKNKIVYLKFLNCFWKLIKFSFNLCFNNSNLFSKTGFFFFNFFFFRLKDGFLKLNVHKKKFIVENKFFSLCTSLENNFSFSNKFFFVNLFRRYLKFLKSNIFLINRKVFVFFHSLKTIFEILVKKYKLKKNLIFLKYIYINSKKR